MEPKERQSILKVKWMSGIIWGLKKMMSVSRVLIIKYNIKHGRFTMQVYIFIHKNS
jgi:hypothetical protein